MYDRHGSEVFEQALPTRGPCKALEWDCDGEVRYLRGKECTFVINDAPEATAAPRFDLRRHLL